MTRDRVDHIRKVIDDQIMNLDPQDAVDVLAEVAMDCDARLEALKEEHGVEPE